jgi:hypothetical protein
METLQRLLALNKSSLSLMFCSVAGSQWSLAVAQGQLAATLCPLRVSDVTWQSRNGR